MVLLAFPTCVYARTDFKGASIFDPWTDTSESNGPYPEGNELTGLENEITPESWPCQLAKHASEPGRKSQLEGLCRDNRAALAMSIPLAIPAVIVLAATVWHFCAEKKPRLAGNGQRCAYQIGRKPMSMSGVEYWHSACRSGWLRSTKWRKVPSLSSNEHEVGEVVYLHGALCQPIRRSQDSIISARGRDRPYCKRTI